MRKWQDIFDDPPEYLEVKIKENQSETVENKIIDIDEVFKSEVETLIPNETGTEDTLDSNQNSSEEQLQEN